MKENFESWGVEELKLIFGCSVDTIYRRVAAAKQGKIRFPLPIDFGIKKCRLRWNPETVRQFCESSQNTPTALLPTNVVTTKQQRKETKSRHERNEIALRSLQSQKVKTDASEE
jgi:predicted DNA-binding transcriptional regulator AlpA